MYKNLRTILKSWTVLLTVVLILMAYLLYKCRPIIVNYAVSEAEGELLLYAENAIANVLSNSITYDKIANVTKDNQQRFTGIEYNINEINAIKSNITSEICKNTTGDRFVDVCIPIGILLNLDFFNALGPEIRFTTQFYESSKIDFVSSFYSAGINQTVHQISLKIRLSGSVVTLGTKKGFSTTTTALVAQTVIVGIVPDDYTLFSGEIIKTSTK